MDEKEAEEEAALEELQRVIDSFIIECVRLSDAKALGSFTCRKIITDEVRSVLYVVRYNARKDERNRIAKIIGCRP